jgi:hypothetical protein
MQDGKICHRRAAARGHWSVTMLLFPFLCSLVGAPPSEEVVDQ